MPTSNGENEGWEKRKLGDILTDPQIKRVLAILNSHHDEDTVLKELKEYFGTIQTDLDAKSTNGDFLAYCILFFLQK